MRRGYHRKKPSLPREQFQQWGRLGGLKNSREHMSAAGKASWRARQARLRELERLAKLAVEQQPHETHSA